VIDFLVERFAGFGSDPALLFRDQVYSYEWLLHATREAGRSGGVGGIPDSSTVSLEADFSPQAIGLLLALIEKNCILVPISQAAREEAPAYSAIAETEYRVGITEQGACTVEPCGREAKHPLLASLRRRQRPGLVLFSSGSTGAPKGALHDFSLLLEKFKTPRPKQTMLAFLLFDHIGGINTLFSSLATGGLLVTTDDRSPDRICELIALHRIETLPTSPTFLNLLLLSEAHLRHDLSSLKTITYGTEMMPESTLARLRAAFPNARLHQTYGLSEIGIMRTKSESSDSLWVKVGGEGFETRVRDGLLEVKARSGMLGYLNAPSPFTEDGWFQTFDAVEVKGEYLRFLGRKSEIINVGGQKVFPSEVESVLESMPEVAGAVVSGEKNALLGEIVKACVRTTAPMPLGEFRRRMREFCAPRLASFKIPQAVEFLDRPEWSDRYKKVRKG